MKHIKIYFTLEVKYLILMSGRRVTLNETEDS